MQKILIVGTIALAALLAGCERIPGTTAHTIAAAEEKAAENLRDPLSAQFRQVKLVVQPAPADSKAKPDRFVCGEMNAKNAYGGYIGFAPFFVDVDRDIVRLDPQEQGTFEEAVRQTHFNELYAISCTVKEKPKASPPAKAAATAPAPKPAKK